MTTSASFVWSITSDRDVYRFSDVSGCVKSNLSGYIPFMPSKIRFNIPPAKLIVSVRFRIYQIY